MKAARGHRLAIAAALACVLVAAGPAGEAAAAGCKGAGQPVRSLTGKQARSAVKCLVNKKRTGMRDLRTSGKLRRAAISHNNYMRRTNCFSHQCPGEASLLKRIRRTGYLNGVRSYSYGEVLAKNRVGATPRDMVSQLMGSSLHRGQLLNRRYEHIGVAVDAKNGVAVATIVLGRTG